MQENLFYNWEDIYFVIIDSNDCELLIAERITFVIYTNKYFKL